MTALSFDADRHVMEPTDMWARYLPSSMTAMAPRLRAGMRSGGAEDLMLGEWPLLHKLTGRIAAHARHVDRTHANASAAATNGRSQLAKMDESRVAYAALFPTMAAYCVYHQYIDAATSGRLAQAYNDWLYDYCAIQPNRLIGVGLVSRHSVDSMLEELGRVIERGWKTVIIRPEPVQNTTIGSSDYSEFWRECTVHGISIAIHGGTHLQGEAVGANRFNTRFALHACAHPLEAQMALLSLLEGGVLEQHPTLRVGFLECGAGWLANWLWRLDELCYDEIPGALKHTLSMKPSDYFRRQCWIGIEPTELGLREAFNLVGPERFLHGTDFPHSDHLDDPLFEIAGSVHSLTEEEISMVRWDNACAFFLGQKYQRSQ